MGARGQVERAAWLYGAAAGLRTALGAPLLPAERALHKRAVADARAALGDDAFAAAWERGQALSLEQAIAEAIAAPADSPAGCRVVP
jgi:hypothetical protein